MRYLSLALTTSLLIACSGTDDAGLGDAGIGQQSQPVATFYFANNSTLSNVPTGTQFCAPTFMSGTDAASQSNILPYNVPECGGAALISSNSASAWPNHCVNPASARQGQMSMTVMCEPLSAYHGVPSQAAVSPIYIQSFAPTGLLEAVSGSSTLWNTVSACWLNGAQSLDVGNEYVWLTAPNGNWQLNVQGFRSIAGSAQCAYFGRNVGSYVYASGTPGNVGHTGMSTSLGRCWPIEIDGQLDQGGWRLNTGTGFWDIEVWGGLSYVKVACTTYN